jgi:hypothetical protein
MEKLKIVVLLKMTILTYITFANYKNVKNPCVVSNNVTLNPFKFHVA